MQVMRNLDGRHLDLARRMERACMGFAIQEILNVLVFMTSEAIIKADLSEMREARTIESVVETLRNNLLANRETGGSA